MAKILSKERVVEYSIEFKIKVVELTYKLDVDAAHIAESLGLHPMMLYRWRQEYREGKFVAVPTRRISMTKDSPQSPVSATESAEVRRLRKEVSKLQKENDFLKKWEGYLTEPKKPDSIS